MGTRIICRILKPISDFAFNTLIGYKDGEPKKYSLGYFIFHAAGKTWVWAAGKLHYYWMIRLLQRGMTMQQINYHLSQQKRDTT